MSTSSAHLQSTLYSSSFMTMSLANFFTASGFGSFFLLPLFITSHGGSKSDIGIVMGIFSLSSVLCRPWISSMIDRIGRKRSYTAGCLLLTILPLAYLLFGGPLKDFYPFLLGVRVLHGMGLAICFTSAFTYIADIIPERRLNEGIAMFGVTGLTGMAVGPVIAEIIIRHFGFSHAFLYASAMGFLGLVLHLRLPESYVKVQQRKEQSFLRVLLLEKQRHVALLAVLFGVGLAASGSFVSPYAKEQNLAFVSLYFISYCSAAVLTRICGGRLADRVGEERIVPRALLVTGLGLLLLVFFKGNLILFVSGFISGCGHGFLFPSLSALAIRGEPAQIRGKVTGVFTGSIDAGAFVGSVILGYIGEWMGFRPLFALATFSLFLGFGFFKYGRFDWKE